MYLHCVVFTPMSTHSQDNILLICICFQFRAMETVVHQNGIDIEALKSARPPLTSQNQAGDSAGNVYEYFINLWWLIVSLVL